MSIISSRPNLGLSGRSIFIFFRAFCFDGRGMQSTRFPPVMAPTQLKARGGGGNTVHEGASTRAWSKEQQRRLTKTAIIGTG